MTSIEREYNRAHQRRQRWLPPITIVTLISATLFDDPIFSLALIAGVGLVSWVALSYPVDKLEALRTLRWTR
jgi:hypothetical protein